jgi:hypothetical protein
MLQIKVKNFLFILKKKRSSLGANAYGTFISPAVTTDAPSNPYAFGSQQSPTVIILGGCPACKV